MQTGRLDSGCPLGQAGQPFPQLAQLKQPDVQQLCGPAHLGPCPLPLDPGFLQAALRGPQLVLQLCVSGFQILQGEGRQCWGPQKVSGVQHLKAGAGDHGPHSAKLFLSAGFLPATCTQDTPWSPSQFELTTFLLEILLSPIVLGMKFRPLPPLLAHSCSAFLASLWFLEYFLPTSGPLHLLCTLPRRQQGAFPQILSGGTRSFNFSTCWTHRTCPYECSSDKVFSESQVSHCWSCC